MIHPGVAVPGGSRSRHGSRHNRLFAEYNARTNETMNEAVQRLDQDQWTHRFRGYFPSVQSLCNHIYVSGHNWLHRFARRREFAFLSHPLFTRKLAFGSVVLETVEAYVAGRRDYPIRAFAAGCSPRI